MEAQNFTQSLETLNLQISNHAMDRYKERVRNNQTNILDEETKNKYTVEIKKLYLSSELMYTGVIGHSSGEVEVYINYMEELDTNNALLKEYKKQIEALTLRNEALNNLIKTEDAKTYQARIKLRNALEDFMVKDKCKVEME